MRLEHAQRVPHRNAADAELFREVALRRQLVSRRQATVANRGLDPSDDLRRNTPCADRAEERGFHGLMVRQLC